MPYPPEGQQSTRQELYLWLSAHAIQWPDRNMATECKGLSMPVRTSLDCMPWIRSMMFLRVNRMRGNRTLTRVQHGTVHAAQHTISQLCHRKVCRWWWLQPAPSSRLIQICFISLKSSRTTSDRLSQITVGWRQQSCCSQWHCQVVLSTVKPCSHYGTLRRCTVGGGSSL
jgi:hypothetical protein